jgi:hypothetical protein
MGATETRIPVSKATRREIRIVKAREDYASYDEALSALVESYDGESK